MKGCSQKEGTCREEQGIEEFSQCYGSAADLSATSISAVPVAFREAWSSSAIHAQDAGTVFHLQADGAPRELLPKDTSLQQ